MSCSLSDTAVLVHRTQYSWGQPSIILSVLKHLLSFWWLMNLSDWFFKWRPFPIVNLFPSPGLRSKRKIWTTNIKMNGRLGGSVFCKAPSALRWCPTISSSHRVQRSSLSVGQSDSELIWVTPRIACFLLAFCLYENAKHEGAHFHSFFCNFLMARMQSNSWRMI